MNSESIVVAMSGGVDSSVAAALLIEKGYNVIGITMKIFDSRSIDSLNDAKSVCQQLGICHHVVDEVIKFKKIVIDNFLSEYLVGRTPNPCVVCNSRIKFGDLFHRSNAIGCNKIATGHYAAVKFNEKTGRWELQRGSDSQKDQSYFLWKISQEQLAHIELPLAKLTKSEVRQLAAKYGFQTANKLESQEICFIPDNGTRDFLRRELADLLKPGEIRDEAGNVLGTHQGIALYTIGQRKGLGLALGKPVYIKEIDPENNVIIMAEDQALYKSELVAEQTNWIAIEKATKPLRVTAKIRYRHSGDRATLYPLADNQVHVVFDKPQRAITPGQSVVFYQKDSIVGGGVIKSN